MSFEEYKDAAYSVWAAAFDAMTEAGMPAAAAATEARSLVQQIMVAWGCMEEGE